MRFVLATANPDKADEIRGVLRSVEIADRPREIPEVEESGDSLLSNARLKAQAVVAATGAPALADDTSLEVDALQDDLGVRTARYANDLPNYSQRIQRLLAELDRVPERARSARFRTVAIAIFPDGQEVVAEGVLEGRISSTPSGGNGFGFDPVFVPLNPGNCTFAELPSSTRLRISHRAQAFRSLAGLLGLEAAKPDA